MWQVFARILPAGLLLGRTVIAHLIRDPLLPPELAASSERDSLTLEMQAYQGLARNLWRQWLAMS